MSVLINKPTVLDYFRAKKDEPIIQFLTWHIVLVAEWKIEDVASIEIRPLPHGDSFLHLLSRIQFRFIFHDGKSETWVVNENARREFYVDSIWKVA